MNPSWTNWPEPRPSGCWGSMAPLEMMCHPTCRLRRSAPAQLVIAVSDATPSLARFIHRSAVVLRKDLTYSEGKSV